MSLLWDVQFLLLATSQELKISLINVLSELEKFEFSSLVRILQHFLFFQKNFIICFLCKYFFMNLRQYLSISLLRDEVLSCLVLVNDRFIKRKAE